MARLAEGDGDYEDEDIAAFEERLRLAWGTPEVKPKLAAFLAHLDAMPRKAIIANRFYRPATGDMCSVAAFCASAGFTPDQIRQTEAQSRLERLENDGVEGSDGWDGPTVDAGVRAGLPGHVAYDLAWHNELKWDRIQDGFREHPGTHYPKGHELHGTHWLRPPWREAIYRDVTDEERWLLLRNFIAAKLGEPQLTPEIVGGKEL